MGPYLSKRQWGTVREDYSEGGDAWRYFTHEQARPRAYRWARLHVPMRVAGSVLALVLARCSRNAASFASVDRPPAASTTSLLVSLTTCSPFPPTNGVNAGQNPDGFFFVGTANGGACDSGTADFTLIDLGTRLTFPGGNGPGGSFTSPIAIKYTGTKHFLTAKQPVTFVVIGTGPSELTYVNPADDPRKK